MATTKRKDLIGRAIVPVCKNPHCKCPKNDLWERADYLFEHSEKGKVFQHFVFKGVIYEMEPNPLEDLKKQLAEAIKEEKYEMASALRDQIAEAEKEDGEYRLIDTGWTEAELYQLPKGAVMLVGMVGHG